MAEINEVDAVLGVHQDVLQFDIFVDVATLVNGIQCIKKLRQDVPDLREGQTVRMDLEQVRTEVLHFNMAQNETPDVFSIKFV